MIRDGKIEISIGGVRKFFGGVCKFFGVILTGSAMLTALTALVFLLPPLDGYKLDRRVDVVQGNEHVIVVDVQETPGTVRALFEEGTTTRYIRTAAGWYSYETGETVDSVDLECAYQGFLMRQKADVVLANVARPETVEVAGTAPSSVGSAAEEVTTDESQND